MIQGEIPIRFKPRGVCDSVAGDYSPPGACVSLANLLHDPSTPNVFVCRPANTKLIDFTSWASSVPNGNAGVVTVAYQVGNIIYGLIGITSGTFSGLDYPFAYDTVGQTFLTLSSVTTAKCPTSQSTSGTWTPPQMTLTGVDLVVTHIGFPGGAGAFFGWFDVTTPSSPTWNVGNTATNVLPSVPQACGTFNNRTRFACGSVVYYTDTLALTMTNSNQSQTVGDYTSVTCLQPLPTSSSALNIIQGLLAFKLNSVSLITGDPITTNLGLNQISASVGTAAPRATVSTPQGVRFMANDGMRLINFFGQLSEPDDDLAVPFINALVPSRAAACFNSDIYRICVQNGADPNSAYQDFWYSARRRAWSGPHNFRYDLAIPLGSNFVLASNSLTGSMWNSFPVQNLAGLGNTFIENGVQLTWTYEPAPMTDLENIYTNALTRATIELAAPATGDTYNFTAQNESGTVLATGAIIEPSNQAIWGHFLWLGANWGASTTGLIPVNIPWNQAAVFNRLSILGNGNSVLGLKIGALHVGYKKLKYILN